MAHTIQVCKSDVSLQTFVYCLKSRLNYRPYLSLIYATQFFLSCVFNFRVLEQYQFIVIRDSIFASCHGNNQNRLENCVGKSRIFQTSGDRWSSYSQRFLSECFGFFNLIVSSSSVSIEPYFNRVLSPTIRTTRLLYSNNRC